MLKWTGMGETTKPQFYTKRHKKLSNAESGRNHLPQGKKKSSPPIGDSILNDHPWKHINKQHYIDWAGYISEYLIYPSVYIYIVDEQRGYEFEREQRGICGKLWKDMERRNNVIYIMISKIKGKTFKWEQMLNRVIIEPSHVLCFPSDELALPGYYLTNFTFLWASWKLFCLKGTKISRCPSESFPEVIHFITWRCYKQI